MPTSQYIVTTTHGEGATVFHALDTLAPEDEQPAIVRSWSTTEPHAYRLAHEWVRYRNILSVENN